MIRIILEKKRLVRLPIADHTTGHMVDRIIDCNLYSSGLPQRKMVIFMSFTIFISKR